MLATNIESLSLAKNSGDLWNSLHNQSLKNCQWDIIDDVEASIEIVVERLHSTAEVEYLHEIEEQDDE